MMTPEQMLSHLSAAGDSDYNDGLGGWFSWVIDIGMGPVSTLTITWQPQDADSEKPGEKTVLTWLIAGPVPSVD